MSLKDKVGDVESASEAVEVMAEVVKDDAGRELDVSTLPKKRTQITARAERALAAISHRGYVSLSKKAVTTLRRLLDMSVESEILDKEGEPTGRFKVDGVLARVQKDIAESILEETGAKKVSKRGGIAVQVNNGQAPEKTGREKRVPAFDNVSSILESCQLEIGETPGRENVKG